MKEKAVLVGCMLPHHSEEQYESSLAELSLLTETAQAEPVTYMIQKRDVKDSSFYIGKGKVEEVKAVVEELEADVVIFNDELTPSQNHNLEKMLPCKVIDRTQLILDIFAMRARSKEGQLQIELAQLKYLLPRIIGKGTSLSRLGGGIGTRGPGETKLEMERRHIRKRMSDIERELEKVKSHRERYRERRRKNEAFQVALVGYTNAGKSTLLNHLTNADTYTEDQLFATLDPTTKRLKLPSGVQVLVSDTVGFIQDLPTTLVAAFRSTLEEVKEANLILHVIDSHDPRYEEQMNVVEKLLNELGAGHIPTIRLFNKKDLPKAEGLLIRSADLYVTALSEDDQYTIKKRIEAEVKQSYQYERLLIPSADADLIAQCRQQGFVESVKWVDEKESYEVCVYLSPHNDLDTYIEPYKNK